MQHKNYRYSRRRREGEGRKKFVQKIIAENFPNLGKEREICVEEAFRSPTFVNAKRPTARHIVVKRAKLNDKERILRAARKEKIIYEGTPIRLSADFSAETLQARREWDEIFKILKDKNLQPRILYAAKISFRYEGEIKTFPDKQNLRDFIATRRSLQEIFKKALIPEKKKRGRQGSQNTE
uniref:L1 transposable element RRM domain-containing protein n=1 Tax=Equus caballus TaxID=9796 RepID=A0A9L0SJZ8_HORSE